MNAGLLVTCSDTDGVEFTDSTPSFRLADGAINDGYYMPDGIHITKTAMNRLASNLQLKVKSRAEGVCHNVVHQTSPHKVTSNGTSNDGWQTQRRRGYAKHNQTSDNKKHQPNVEYASIKSSRVNSNATPVSPRSTFCNFCGEIGHKQDKCRHGRKLECHTCNREGHKAKLCHLYD